MIAYNVPMAALGFDMIKLIGRPDDSVQRTVARIGDLQLATLTLQS